MAYRTVSKRQAYVNVLLVFFLLMILSPSGFSTSLDPVHANKTSKKILEKSEAGQPQDLFILFETKALDDSIVEKQRDRGLNHENQELIEEKRRGYDSIKKGVLQALQQSGMTIVEDYRNLPITMVHVPNIWVLERILKHPKVQTVYGEQSYKPISIEIFL